MIEVRPVHAQKALLSIPVTFSGIDMEVSFETALNASSRMYFSDSGRITEVSFCDMSKAFLPISFVPSGTVYTVLGFPMG